jgi:hypothetical protein
MMVAHIFGIRSVNGLQLYCFASGRRFETGEVRQVATCCFTSGIVKCAKWPPAATAVMPLLRTTRLEAVSIVPLFFLAGNPATAERSATHVLYSPWEALPAMEEDLLKKLLALRADLEPLAIAEVQKQAEKTARGAHARGHWEHRGIEPGEAKKSRAGTRTT